MPQAKQPTQVVGNTGLYYVCYELSQRGWNVLPTSRNARGVDVIIYSSAAQRTHTIQVKALSVRAAAPLGSDLRHLIADFVIVCRLAKTQPECFVMSTSELEGRVVRSTTQRGTSHWLEPKVYEQYAENWAAIGPGYDQE